MSGRKQTYSYVSDDELRRLRNQAARATSLAESNRILNQLSRKNDDALADYRRRIAAMDTSMRNLSSAMAAQAASSKREVQAIRSQLQTAVNESNARIQTMARENQQNIANMQSRFTQDLRQTKEEMEQTIQTNNRRIEAAMEQNNRRVATAIENMNTQVSDLSERVGAIDAAVQDMTTGAATLAEMAREYVGTSELLVSDMNENYRPELLLPGRMAELQRLIGLAKDDIRTAESNIMNAPVARASARSAAAAALQLHQDLLQAEQEWNLHYQAARQALAATETQLEASRNIEISGEYGTARVDVDHWSGGDLSSIGRRVGALADCLENAEEMTIQQLDHVQSAGAQASREIDDTTVFAAEAFYSSQDRADIAADIAENLLENLGLQVAAHSYQGNDQRASHRLHLKNPATGFEMVVTQTPEKDETGRIVNRLESDILNYGMSNMEAGDEIARGALSALEGLGFKQTEVETVSGYENRQSDRTECANMQEWQQEKQPAVLKPEHEAAKKS